MLKKFYLIKFIHTIIYKIVSTIQIFAKLPNDEEGVCEARNLIKYILNMPNKLMTIGDDSLNSIINSENKLFVNKTNGLLSASFSPNDNPKILVISHQFSLTGAPKAALMLAKSIRYIFGVAPMVLSMTKGPMEEEFLKENFPILYNVDLPILKEDFIAFFNSFDLIIANSYLFEFMKKVKYINTPVIWWDHEILGRKGEFSSAKKFLPYLHSCWGGSPLSLKQLKNLNKTNPNYLVLYGLPEISLPEIKREDNDKIVFSLMGTFIPRKRQDLLLEALKKMSPEIRKKAVFYVIGDPCDPKIDTYGIKLLEKFKEIPEVKVISEMSFNQLLEFYSKSDVILSTSDFDPMPIVITYGLMFKKLCICSDAIGTALLINDKENGVLFKAGNKNDLCLKLTDIIKNYKNYKDIAQNGYNVYEKNFSEFVFNANIKKYINKAIKEKK